MNPFLPLSVALSILCYPLIFYLPEPDGLAMLRWDLRWYLIGPPIEKPRIKSTWPVTTLNVQPIRYCFVAASDYDTLSALLTAAIKKWDLAISQSALQIIPDQLPTSPDDHHLCSDPNVSEDALQIEDVTDEPNPYSIGSFTVVGYLGDDAYHTIDFRRQHGRSDESRGVQEEDAIAMAHELGHAIGFAHEHSRPDAAEYIDFYCDHLPDFEEVMYRIWAYGNQDTIEEACTNRTIAEKYHFSARNWLAHPPPYGKVDQLLWSTPFEVDSIMIYPSDVFGDRFLPVILRKDGSVVKMAGGKGTISAGDAARVAMLYPKRELFEI